MLVSTVTSTDWGFFVNRVDANAQPVQDDRKVDARAAILQAATRIFCEQGYDAASLQAIIDASGTSKGTLYHYFSSKEDLYTHVLEGTMQQMWAVTFRTGDMLAATVENFWQVLSQSWRRSVQYQIENPELIRLWRDYQVCWRVLGDVGPARRIRETNIALVEGLILQGQLLGCVRRDLSARQCAELIEAVDLVADRWFINACEGEDITVILQRHAPLALDIIWRLLAAPTELHPETVCPMHDTE